MRLPNEMVLAFLLVVTMDGLPLDTEGMLFRDIHRCSFFAREIETSANQTWVGNVYKYRIKSRAWCKPVFVPAETRFWD